MHKFKDLLIWQKSRLLVKKVYNLINSFPNNEKYSLVNQIQRSAISIPSNIAEGAGRATNLDFIRFLDIAYSSSYELETQVILACDLNYIDDEQSSSIINDIEEIQKMIYILILKLKEKS